MVSKHRDLVKWSWSKFQNASADGSSDIISVFMLEFASKKWQAMSMVLAGSGCNLLVVNGFSYVVLAILFFYILLRFTYKFPGISLFLLTGKSCVSSM